MNLGSAGIVLKITFYVSHWIQLKFKGYLVHYQNKLLYLKVVVNPFCGTCNRKNSQPKSRLECMQCKFVFHKKMSKISNVSTFVCNFCNKETFPFVEIDLRDLIDLSLNSSYICSCLETIN